MCCWSPGSRQSHKKLWMHLTFDREIPRLVWLSVQLLKRPFVKKTNLILLVLAYNLNERLQRTSPSGSRPTPALIYRKYPFIKCATNATKNALQLSQMRHRQVSYLSRKTGTVHPFGKFRAAIPVEPRFCSSWQLALFV